MMLVKLPRPEGTFSIRAGGTWSDYLTHTIKPWCGDHIGFGRVVIRDADKELTGEEVWYCEQYYGFANFYFINSSDATLFRLKWL